MNRPKIKSLSLFTKGEDPTVYVFYVHSHTPLMLSRSIPHSPTSPRSRWPLASTYIYTTAARRSYLRTQPPHASLLLFLLQSPARREGSRSEMLLHRPKLPLLCCGSVDDDTAKNAGKSARQLSWAQVEAMTAGFTSAVVGEGGFSTVYLARLSGGSKPQLAAVKVHRSCSEHLRRAFRQELDALLRVRHPHIVRLLAFCDRRDESVLVLEFAPNGNLHEKLHGVDGKLVPTTMPWARRVAVALQVARALEYLHDRCEPQVVHGDVKASNVLLDASMGVRLCDFGSARAGFSATVRPPRAVLGSPRYVDPHYLRSGVLTKKSDVYSFGVLLLELLTGTQPFQDGRLLTSTVAPMIKAGSCDVHKLVDQRLGCKYDGAEAAAVATLATACVGENPTLRPSMADVVRSLEQISAAGR